MQAKLLNALPDLTLFVSIIIALLLGKLFPDTQLPAATVSSVVGAVLIVGSLGLSMAILAFMIRRGGSTDVVKTSKLLITDKYFRLSRNPLYLVELLFVVGVATFAGSPVSFIGPAIYFLVLNFVVIPHEERELEKVFGNKYLQYKQSTRRWL
jgi:protein-S-isoprenylcysteine O-methyltransferase Ste14